MCGWLGKLKDRIRRTCRLLSPKVLSLSTWSADVSIYILWTSQLCCYYQNMLIFLNALLIGLFFSHSVVSDSLWPHGLQHARLPCPSLSPRAYSNPRPLSQWCHPTVSSSVIPFSSCPQSFPSSGSFPVSWLFTSGGQSIGASASSSVLPMNIQGWFPLGLTSWSPHSPRDSQVFSSTMIRKHQFFGTQPALWSNSHIHIWLLEKP